MNNLNQANTAYGSDYSGTPYSAPSPQVAPSFTIQLTDRLSALQATLGDAYESLDSLSTRLLGPAPSPVVGGAQSGQPGTPPSVSDSLLAQVEILNRGAEELARRARLLNGRI